MNFNSEMARERAERRKEELGSAIRAAREAGDDVRVSELQSQLQDVTAAAKDAAKRATKEEKPAAPADKTAVPVVQPWLKEWISENDEFLKTPRKSAMLNAIVQEKRQAGDERVGREFMDEVRDEVETFLESKSGLRPSRTEETRPTGGGSRGNGRGQTYADLPADAKEQCDKDAKRYVGPTKIFKDEAAWRKHFAKEYFR